MKRLLILCVCLGVVGNCYADKWEWKKSKKYVAYAEHWNDTKYSYNKPSTQLYRKWLHLSSDYRRWDTWHRLLKDKDHIDIEILAFRKEDYKYIENEEASKIFRDIYYLKVKDDITGEIIEGYLDPEYRVEVRRKEGTNDIGGHIRQETINEKLHSYWSR